MDGWMDGRAEGRTDGRRDGRTDEWMENARLDRQQDITSLKLYLAFSEQ